MSTSIADLAVNISTNIASLETGMAKAADVVSRAAADMSRQFDGLSGRIDSVTGAFKTLAAVATVGFGAKAFSDFITSSIDAQAQLSILAEKVGTTASQLSSLIPAAKLSGTSLDDIANLSAKFSKNLLAVQDGTGKAAAAFKTLGFNAQDAARFLANPTQGLLELGQRLNQFATDGNKTAVAMELIGKNAQNLLPFLQQLGQQTELQTRVSDEQAAAARRLEDEYKTMQLRGDELRNAIATGLVPAFSGLLKAFTDTSGGADSLGQKIKDLAGDGTFGIWAAKLAITISTVAESVAFLVTAVSAFAASAKVVAGDISSLAIFHIFNTVEENKKMLDQRNADVEDANKKWNSLWNDNFTIISTALKKELDDLEATRVATNKTLALQAQAVKDFAKNADALDLGKGQTKPTLDTGGVTAIAKVNEFAKAMQDFRKAAAEADQQLGDLFSGENTTKAEKALAALKASDVWATFTAGQKAAIDGMAQLAISVEKNVATITAYNALLTTLTGTLDNFAPDFAAKFKTLTDAFNLGITDLEQYRDQVQRLLNQQPFAKREADAMKELIKQTEQEIKDLASMQDQATKALSAYADQNTRLAAEADLIGLSNADREKALILLDAQADRQKLINAGDVEGLAILDDQIKKRQDLVDTRTQREDFVNGWTDVFKTIGDKAQEFVANFVKTGKLDFKSLWQDFETWALSTLAKIAAQKIVVQIATSFGLGGVAQNAFAGSNSGAGNLISSLFGGGGGGLFGQAFGNSQFDSSGAGVGFGAGGLLSDAGAFLPALSAIGPLVPLLGLAIPLLSGLFSKTPSDVKGQFGFSSGTSGFEDNAFTASKFGNLGFLDAGTQQFSGQAAQVFNKIVSGALDAFDARMSTEGKQRLSDILKNTVFASFEGTFTTEDFLQKYGGQVLQQVATAAFNVLDPALGSVEAAFSGTADQVSTFTNTLLAIYDASKGFSDTFAANIIGALGDSTQATADKVLAFVQIIDEFGNGLDPISVTLQGLSATDIPAFIDALGGAKSALSEMTFLFDNFYTGTQKIASATNLLNKDFSDLGITQIPETHAQFLALLNSFDLTTEAGRKMYASVLALAPLFVEVHGTADQAAGSISNVNTALSQTAKSAEDFFNQNFFSDAEKSAQKYKDDLKQIDDAQTALGITIPHSIDGFKALILSIDRTTPAGEALYEKLILLAPAVYDLGTAATTTANNISSAVDAINNIPYPDTSSAAKKFVDKFLKQIQDLSGKSTGDFGDKAGIQIPLIGNQIDAIHAAIAKEFQLTGGVFDTTIETYQTELDLLNTYNDTLTSQLGQFTILKAQYGAQIAQQLVDLQTWYDNQAHILRNNSAALADLQVIFKQNWDAIIAGTSTGVTGTIDQLAKLREAILAYANGLTLGNLSPLSPQQKLADAQSQFAAELAKAKGGDQGALGDITKFADTYLNLARSNFASSSQYTDIFVAVQNALRALGTPPPLTGPGSVPIPTTVVTTNGSPVATSADVQQANATLQELLARLSDLSRADRQAYLAANADAAAEIAAAVKDSGKKIGDLLGGVGRK